jgi:acyl-CoA reductase-like NAD-dependent aldehyde dehydrogenase
MGNEAKMQADLKRIPMLIGGEWREGTTVDAVNDPYRNETVSYQPRSTLADLDDAVKAAVAAKTVIAAMPGFERAALLRRVSALLLERADMIAEVMSRETGKALKDARGEVVRSQDTINLSAEEAIRIEGEHIPLDGSAMGAGKIALMLRFRRCHCGHHAIQCAVQLGGSQDRSGHCRRQCDHPQGAATGARRRA